MMTTQRSIASPSFTVFHFLVIVITIFSVCSTFGFGFQIDTEPTKSRLKSAMHFKRRSAKSDTNVDNRTHTCSQKRTCEECVSFTSYCRWCTNGDKCTHLEIKSLLPQDPKCAWQDTKWGECWVNFTALIISVCTIFGIILIIACCCVVKCCRCVVDCCHVCTSCCCDPCRENRASREAMQQLRKLERKLDNQAKRNELMLKFGTQRNHGVPYGSTGSYKNFENTEM